MSGIDGSSCEHLTDSWGHNPSFYHSGKVEETSYVMLCPQPRWVSIVSRVLCPLLIIFCLSVWWQWQLANMELRVGNKYRLGRKIGSGSFGDIYLGKCKLTLFSFVFACRTQLSMCLLCLVSFHISFWTVSLFILYHLFSPLSGHWTWFSFMYIHHLPGTRTIAMALTAVVQFKTPILFVLWEQFVEACRVVQQHNMGTI